MLPIGQRYAPPIVQCHKVVTYWSKNCVQCCLKDVPTSPKKLFKSCPKVASKLPISCPKSSQSYPFFLHICLKVDSKLSQICLKVLPKSLKVVSKLSKIDPKLIQICHNLYQNCTKVVSKLFQVFSMKFPSGAQKLSNAVSKWCQVVCSCSTIWAKCVQ